MFSYANGLIFDFVDYTTDIKVSSDGQTWTSGSRPRSNNYTPVVWCNGYYCAADVSQRYVIYSSNGVNWTEVDLSGVLVVAPNSLAVFNNQFVLVSALKMLVSSDGANWTGYDTVFSKSIGQAFTVRPWTSAGHVVIGVSTVSGQKTIALTTDFGATWDVSSTLPTTSPGIVAIGDGKFVIGAGTGLEFTSDLSTWTSKTFPAQSYPMTALGFGNGKWLAGTPGSSSIYVADTNFIYQATRNPAWGQNQDIVGFAYNGSNLWVAASNSQIATSPDTVTWTPRTFTWSATKGLQYLNGAWYAYGRYIVRSTDGVNWTEVLDIGSGGQEIKYLYYTGTSFLGLIANGLGSADLALVTSNDGINWTVTAKDNMLLDNRTMHYSGGKWMFDSGGTLAVTEDFVSYTAPESPYDARCLLPAQSYLFSDAAYSVCVSDTGNIGSWVFEYNTAANFQPNNYGQYAIVGDNIVLIDNNSGPLNTWRTSDGINWTEDATGSMTGDFYAIAYYNGEYRAVTVFDHSDGYGGGPYDVYTYSSLDGVTWGAEVLQDSVVCNSGLAFMAFIGGCFYLQDSEGNLVRACTIPLTCWTNHIGQQEVSP